MPARARPRAAERPRATPCESLRPRQPSARGRRYAIGRRRLADFSRLFLAAREAISAATHRGEELLEIDLEGGEDLIGVVLGAEPDLALGLASVLDDLLGGALGLLVDLLLGDQAGLLVASFLHDALRLPLGFGDHLLALLDDPPRLLDLLGDRRPDLVEQVVDLLAVHPHLVRQRDRARVVDQVVELVD